MADNSNIRQVKIVDDNDNDDRSSHNFQALPKDKKKSSQKKGILKEELSKMMYGFGEDNNPRDDTLELMETYVIEFISNVVKRSFARSQRAGSNTITMRDLLKVIQEDEKKYLRVPYLLTSLQAFEEIQKNYSKYTQQQDSSKPTR